MRLSSLVGLPVLCAQDGDVLGTVSGWLLDQKQKRVACLLVDTGNWYDSAQGLRFEGVLGIGEGAVIIKNRQDMAPLGSDPALRQAAQRRLTGIDAPLYTPVGERLGQVAEIEADERGMPTALITDRDESIPGRRILVMGHVFLVAQKDEPAKPAAGSPAAQQSGQEVLVKSSVGNPIVIKTPPPPDLDSLP